GGADRTDVLGRVAVSQHDLQPASTVVEALLYLWQLQHPGQDVGRGLQVGTGLEQRDDVEDGPSALGQGVGDQLVDGGDVLGRAGEADDVPAAGVHAEAFLDPGDDPQGRQDLLGAFGRSGPRTQFLQRCGVYLAVLANLQFGEVEAEGLGLPDQVLEFTVGLSDRAGRGQGFLHDPQVGEEGFRVGVGQVGIAFTGGAEPGRGQEQQLSVG